MHPSDEIKAIKSQILLNKKIVLAVTGSIAAVETIKLARELIRHGAEIIPVMTPNAAKIIHPDALWFATGKKPIIELTGETEHVTYCGKTKEHADLLLICPATANTISKITHGIDDTTVTTFATTAIGSKIPIIIVPAMHLSMYEHKILQKNIHDLRKNKIEILQPIIDKNKAKTPSQETIILHVIKKLKTSDYKSKRILIIGGPTTEKIDDIRVITNISTGKTAIQLAKNAYYRDAEVELWIGNTTEKIPEYIKTMNFSDNESLQELIKKHDLAKYDIIINCAAISDYKPEKYNGKIPSGQKILKIDMKPTQKILPLLTKKAPKAKIIAFKAEEKKEKLKEKSQKLIDEYKIDLVIANTLKGFQKDENEILIYNKKTQIFKKGKKETLAEIILDEVKKTIE